MVEKVTVAEVKGAKPLALVAPITDSLIVAAARGNVDGFQPRSRAMKDCGWKGHDLADAVEKAGIKLPVKIRDAAGVCRMLADYWFTMTPWQPGVDHQFAPGSCRAVRCGDDHIAIEKAQVETHKALYVVSDRVCGLLEEAGFTASVNNDGPDSYRTVLYQGGKPIASL